jgi:hypothetical protein
MIQFNGSKHFEVMTIIMQCSAAKNMPCVHSTVSTYHTTVNTTIIRDLI